MLIIGLTGPSGAGKSIVAELFARFDIPVIDADNVYHHLLVPPSSCLEELIDRFGGGILTPEGTLDRAKLGSVVFADHAALEDLNHITHRYVMEEIRARMEKFRKAGTRAVLLDAPQLFEAGADRECGVIISVLADKKLRAERIMSRDNIDAETAMRRINAQKGDEFFRAHSDYVIENNENPEKLLPAVKTILCETGVLPS